MPHDLCKGFCTYLISGVPLRNCVTEMSDPRTIVLSIDLYSADLDATKIAFLIVTFSKTSLVYKFQVKIAG